MCKVFNAYQPNGALKLHPESANWALNMLLFYAFVAHLIRLKEHQKNAVPSPIFKLWCFICTNKDANFCAYKFQ